MSCDQVFADMSIQVNGRFRDDFLARRLDPDTRMHVNMELFEVLHMMRAERRCERDRRWCRVPPSGKAHLSRDR